MTPKDLRTEVMAYQEVEDSPTLYPYGSDIFLYLEPADDGEDDASTSDDDVVHLEGSPTDFLGTERLDARVLAPLYTAAEDLLVREPQNDALASAATKLREGFLPGVAPRRIYGRDTVAALASAIRACQRVGIVYSRLWRPGIEERVIEPYRLISTRRGYEVDAGPVDAEGRLRTFLISGIREYHVLDEEFVRPRDTATMSLRERQTIQISGFVAQTGRWAVNKYSEDVRWFDDEIEEGRVYFEADILPPYGDRVALLALCAGEGTLLDQVEYDGAIEALARELWDLHNLDAE